MTNLIIREEAKRHSVKLWQIAAKLGKSDSDFSRMLRTELPSEKKKQILEIIDRLSKSSEVD